MNPWNAPPISPSETYFSLRASRALQRAFSAITTESLATYLFSASPRIPSESFSSSLVLHMSHKLTHSGLSDPRRAFKSPLITYRPTIESSSINLVLTPIRREASTLLGVVSVAGVVVNSSLFPFSEALHRGIQRGRFVYNGEKKQLVCLMDGLSKDELGVVSATWTGEVVREKFFFIIPRRQYSFDDMPKLAAVVLSNLEYRISKVHDDDTILDDSNSEPGHDSLFENFTKPEGQNAVVGLQKSDAFDMSAITTAIESLAKDMSGLYYGPNLKRDVINISTGELSSRASAKIVARMSVPDYVGQCRIRRLVAQDYFLQLLPPGSERWFSQKEVEQGLGSTVNDIDEDVDFVVEETLVGDGDPLSDVYHLDSVIANISQSGKAQQTTSTMGEPVLASSMLTSLSVPKPLDVASTTERVLTDEELKKERDEERRIRNRISAAKSNERRKEREQAQRKELEMLKERKVLLEAVQQQLIDENVALRKQAESRAWE